MQIYYVTVPEVRSLRQVSLWSYICVFRIGTVELGEAGDERWASAGPSEVRK